MLKHTVSAVCVHCLDKLPSDERSAGGPGEGEPSLNGSPGRPFLLYRQRHVLFSAGRKENVGLKQWVLETATPFWVKDEETYAPSTRNEYLFYALVYFVGAYGVVLSSGRKVPKGRWGVAMRPRPLTLPLLRGLRPPGRSAKPPGTKVLCGTNKQTPIYK